MRFHIRISPACNSHILLLQLLRSAREKGGGGGGGAHPPPLVDMHVFGLPPAFPTAPLIMISLKSIWNCIIVYTSVCFTCMPKLLRNCNTISDVHGQHGFVRT